MRGRGAKLREVTEAGRDERGNVAAMTAFTLVPLVILLSGAINFGFAWTVRNFLQATADAAALAGASQLGDDDLVLVEANEFAENNMPASINGDVLADEDVEIGNWNSATRVFTPGGTPENAVRATTRRTEATSNPVPTFLGTFIGRDEWNLVTVAIAAKASYGHGCVLALDPDLAGAITITGSAVLTLNGCNAMSNSTHPQSFTVTGSGTGTMPCALSSGSVWEGGASNLTLTECDGPMNNVTAAEDPFDYLTEPEVTGPCKTLPTSQAATIITPGRFCGGGELKGTKHFDPGLYIIDGGTFRISANANVTGAGVTFFLTNNANVHFNANGTMTLSAPTSGAYQGILFWGDDDNLFNDGDSEDNPYNNVFNGTPTSSLTGALYFPNQSVEYRGNFSGTNGCMRIVARTIDFRGNTAMSVTCPNLASLPLSGKLALVD